MPPRLLAAATFALVAIPTLAAAQPSSSQPQPPQAPVMTYAEPGPDRSGFTFELDLGLGVTVISPEDREGDSRNGLSGLNLGLGGWITPQTALTVRVTGNSFDIHGTQFVAGLLGVVVQQMVSDKAWVGGGVGLAILTDDDELTEPESGIGLDFRAGYNFYQSRRNAFHIALEVTPGFFDGGRITATGLQLGWQSL